MRSPLPPAPPLLVALYQELCDYLSLREEHLCRGPEIWKHLESSAAELVEDFYSEILRHEETRRVLQGTTQVARLKATLENWLRELFAGRYDADFVARRWQVGFRHVQIGLPSIWVSAAMARLRQRVVAILADRCQENPVEGAALGGIAARMMDVDLALIQDAYNAEVLSRQLTRERDFAEGVIQTAQAVVLVVDPRGAILRGNAFLASLLGWSGGIDPPAGLRFQDLVPAAEVAPIDQFLRNVLAGSAPAPLETSLLPASGPPRRIRWLARQYQPPATSALPPARDPALDEPLPAATNPWILCVGQDISDLKEIQRQLVRHARLAAIGQTMTGLAHESRNAFQRSQAALETLLLELEDRPVAVELIERIQRAHDHLLHLYEEVLQFARPVRLELQQIQLDSILRQTWEHLGSLVAEKQVDLRWNREHPSTTILADPFALEQILRNLLENGVEASDPGGTIEIEVTPAWIGSVAAVRVEIRDYGRGIPPPYLARIFEPFFTTRPRGTGLGLPIARRLAEGHGGSLQLEGADPGVLAILILPLVALPDPEIQLPSEDTRRS